MYLLPFALGNFGGRLDDAPNERAVDYDDCREDLRARQNACRHVQCQRRNRRRSADFFVTHCAKHAYCRTAIKKSACVTRLVNALLV